MFASALALLVVATHARQVLWRDEAQPLVLAREADDAVLLWRLLREEGTPGLWHLLLRALAGAGLLSPLAAQVLCAAAAVGFLITVLGTWRAPLLFRAWVTVSGATAWYLVNVRQYALTLVLLVVLAELRARAVRPGVQAALLFLLCQSSLPGCWLAGAWWLHGLISPGVDGRTRRAAHVAMAVAAPLAVLQLWPVPGLLGRDGSLSLNLAALPDALVALARCTAGDPASAVLLGVMTWRIAVREHHRAWLAVVVALGGAAGVALGVALAAYPQPFQLWMMHFLWLALLRQHVDAAWHWPRAPIRNAVVAAAVALGAWDAWVEVEARWRLPASRGAEVAALLDQAVPEVPVLVRAEAFYTPVLAYRRNRPPTWSLARGAYVRFARWDHRSMDHVRNPDSENLRMSDVVAQVRALPPELRDAWPVVVLSGLTLTHDVEGPPERVLLGDGRALALVAELRGAIHESYRVYRVVPGAP
ncbi:MAG: hypothetical protein HY904_22675 [Deltaproteobacteria bacterium]|nr:hypothetical protein [Deltaproteobacteria bacterium]